VSEVAQYGSLEAFLCQISDSTTSYGSYSGAVPNEKISWGKLEASAASFIIESACSTTDEAQAGGSSVTGAIRIALGGAAVHHERGERRPCRWL
jgi:hypothetical protein